MRLIDKHLLKQVSEQAKQSVRLRMNYNFHASLEAKSQRLLNALEPGTQLPIHRHPHTAETYLVLSGSIRVDYYNANKTIEASAVLNPKQEVYGLDIPAGQYHTLEVLEAGTVIFEVKDGPYLPLAPADILDVSTVR